jgi:hypothetical protein
LAGFAASSPECGSRALKTPVLTAFQCFEYGDGKLGVSCPENNAKRRTAGCVLEYQRFVTRVPSGWAESCGGLSNNAAEHYAAMGLGPIVHYHAYWYTIVEGRPCHSHPHPRAPVGIGAQASDAYSRRWPMRSDFVRRFVATLAVFGIAAAIPLPPGTIDAQESTRTPISQREAMRNVSGPELIRRLSDTTSRMAAYALNRREWKDELERIATSRPEDYEGQQPVPGADRDKQAVYRSHDARIIAAIWNEDDSPTRAKLLLAFGFQVHGSSWRDEGERFVLDTIQKQLRESVGGLSPEQAKRIDEFVDFCEKNVDHRSGNGNGFADLARKIRVAIPASPKN